MIELTCQLDRLGEKDFQQLRIIENLVLDQKFDTKVVRCKTVRSPDGLALSSRNKKLSFSSAKIATNLGLIIRKLILI